MTASPAPMPPLPTQETHQQMMACCTRSPADVQGALKLLKEHPGLARSDEEWVKAFPHQLPLLSFAVQRRLPSELFDAILAACPTPGASVDGTNALEAVFLKGNNTSTRDIEMARALLAHPAYAEVNGWNMKGISHFLGAKDTPDTSEDRLNIFRTVLDQTNPDTLKKRGSFSTIYYTGFPAPMAIAVLRELAERGVDLNSFSFGHQHPMKTADYSKNEEIAAALLAAGMDENGICEIPSYERGDGLPLPPWPVKHYLDYPGSDKEKGKRIRARADAMLEEQIAEVTQGNLTPEELLFTRGGRASWQARGLAQRGMLDRVFSPDGNGIFDSADTQAHAAVRLYHALGEPLNAHIEIARHSREASLARPGTSAAVLYVQGPATQAHGKGSA